MVSLFFFIWRLFDGALLEERSNYHSRQFLQNVEKSGVHTFCPSHTLVMILVIDTLVAGGLAFQG